MTSRTPKTTSQLAAEKICPDVLDSLSDGVSDQLNQKQEFSYARPEPSNLLVSLRDIQERTIRQ